jgi:hypothetical protein
MRSCPRCGKQNPEGNVFCGSCGSALTSGDPAAERAVESAAEVQLSRRTITPAPYAYEAPTVESERRRRRGIEFIPWRELTPGQKLGRSIALLLLASILIGILWTAANFLFDRAG